MTKRPQPDPTPPGTARLRRLLVAAALAVVGGVLLWRALQGGGPLYYFASAVFIGMAYAAAQGARGR